MAMETRILKISSCKAGGSAGAQTLKYRVNLPSQWIRAMGLDGQEQELLMGFDGEQITIRKNFATEIDRFLAQAIAQGHDVFEYRYYNGDQLCSRIMADFTAYSIRVENQQDALVVHMAFGVTPNPSWPDFMAFLEERCVPSTREGLGDYLSTIGLDRYDPVSIVAVTQGRMAEDKQWLEVVKR